MPQTDCLLTTPHPSPAHPTQKTREQWKTINNYKRKTKASTCTTNTNTSGHIQRRNNYEKFSFALKLRPHKERNINLASFIAFILFKSLCLPWCACVCTFLKRKYPYVAKHQSRLFFSLAGLNLQRIHPLRHLFSPKLL